MKINWFGRMYYGDKLEYKRNLWVAFKCFVEWDIYHKILGTHYIRGEKRYFNWYRRYKDKNYGLIIRDIKP